MKTALLVWGGWEGHSPEACSKIFAPWLQNQGYNVRVSDTLDTYLDLEYLKSLDLIVPIWTQGEISTEQEENLLAAIADGVGIAGWHGGMADSFRTSTNYQFMVGGQWVAHPGGFINYQVKIVNKEDAITAGIRDFTISTEQYYMHVDPSNQVLATTTFKGNQIISKTAPYESPWISECIIPVVWKRRWGKGKVFYSSIGHKLDDFDVPEVLEISRRGMIWATK